jgi:hypothetical protein
MIFHRPPRPKQGTETELDSVGPSKPGNLALTMTIVHHHIINKTMISLGVKLLIIITITLITQLFPKVVVQPPTIWV